MPIYKRVDKEFFKKWSPNMAYVLGFFAADGYMIINKRGGQFWCISITDQGLLEEIRRVIDSEHKISFRKGRGNDRDQYRIQIGSIDMCEDLRKLGFAPNKTKSLAVPNVPKEYFASFARGYFDGDGGVWKGLIHKERNTPLETLRVSFTSSSKDFLFLLRIRFMDFGIENGVLSTGAGNYHRLTYSMHSSLKLYAFMYNNLGTSRLFLKRKKDVFEEFIQMRS